MNNRHSKLRAASALCALSAALTAGSGSPAAWAANAASAPAAATAPSGTARPGSTLRLEGPGPYHRLVLPLAWQAQSRRGASLTPNDLGDLRLFNARGEALPYAWDPLPEASAPEERTQSVSLAVFRWAGPRSAPAALKSRSGRDAPSSPSLSHLPTPDTPSWPVWVMDTQGRLPPAPEVPSRHSSTATPPERQSIQLQIQLAVDQPSGIFALALETSDDLQHWQTLDDRIALARLAQSGQTLVQDSLELSDRPQRYLRLRSLPGSAVPQIDGARLLITTSTSPVPVWSWSDSLSPVRCDAIWCEYNVPSEVPLTRLKVLLTTPNTLLPLLVQTRPAMAAASLPHDAAQRGDDASTHPHRPHLRERLREIRHQNRERPDADADADADAAVSAAAAEFGWITTTQAQVYWLQWAQQDRLQDRRQEDIPLPAVNTTRLRIGTPGHPQSGWSHSAPQIQIATWARSLVFLDQGPTPYRLEWAAPRAAPVALPMAQLRPDSAYGTEMNRAALETPAPPLAETAARSATGAAVGTGNQASAAAAAASSAGVGAGRWPWAWLLWATLLLGVGIMAYLVRSVFSTRSSDPDAGPPPPP